MRSTRWAGTGLVFALMGAAACGGSGPPARGGALMPAVSGSTRWGNPACGTAHPRNPVSPLNAQHTGSTLALGRSNDRTLAYVADEDERAIVTVDVDARKELAKTPLQGRPSQVLLAADGRLFVALRDVSKLVVLESTDRVEAPLGTRCAVDTAVEPVALAATPDDKMLLVSSAWGRTLAAYDAASLGRVFQVALPREPRAVVVSNDGERAFVSHAVGAQATLVDLRAHRVTPIPLRGLEQGQALELEASKGDELSEKNDDGGTTRASCQGFALAKTLAPKERVLAPQVLVDPGDPSQQPDGYGNPDEPTEQPNIAVLDAMTGAPLLASLEHVSDPISDEDARERQAGECLLPRAAAFDPTSQSLLVACFGIDALIAYDAFAASPARAERRRWTVGSGPTGVAVDAEHKRAIVWSQFERTLDIVSLDVELVDEKLSPPAKPDRIALSSSPERAMPVALALGRQLFHASGDARISRDGRACASCHPDGRDDALAWATPQGPRRSIMLAGRVADKGVYSWSNHETSLKEHLAVTFDRLGGAGGLRGVELDALVAYVRSLAPPPRPALHDPMVERGRRVFASKEAGCATCHVEGTFADNRAHDVKSGTSADKTKAFNTPSLRFVGGTGPYFHDGRYATLRELLTASDGKMGHTRHLSPEDLDALEAYLRSL